MTLSIRISQNGAPQPGSGFVGAMGGTIPGASIDVEITEDEIKSTADAIAFVGAAVPQAAVAFGTIAARTGTVVNLTVDMANAEDDAEDEADEPLIEADVLDNEPEEDETGVAAHKARLKAQRQRAREIIHSHIDRIDTSFKQDVRESVKALEAEGIIR